MSGFSDNAAIKAVSLVFKGVYYLFRALWKGITYGFRAYKQHQNKSPRHP